MLRRVRDDNLQVRAEDLCQATRIALIIDLFSRHGDQLAGRPFERPMFAVIYTLFLKCKDGDLTFERAEELPFVPYADLAIEDDAVGEFQIEHTLWSGAEKCFSCQSNFNYLDGYSMRSNTMRMKKAGWKEVKHEEVIKVRRRKADLDKS